MLNGHDSIHHMSRKANLLVSQLLGSFSFAGENDYGCDWAGGPTGQLGTEGISQPEQGERGIP
jgi:hypothetical protein